MSLLLQIGQQIGGVLIISMGIHENIYVESVPGLALNGSQSSHTYHTLLTFQ